MNSSEKGNWCVMRVEVMRKEKDKWRSRIKIKDYFLNSEGDKFCMYVLLFARVYNENQETLKPHILY